MNTLKFSLAILLVNGFCSIHAMERSLLLKQNDKEISAVMRQIQNSSTKKLMDACKDEKKTVSREYIESLIFNGGALVNFQDKYGRTPLHYAAEKGKIECVMLLLEKKASVHASDSFGITPLSCAKSQGHDIIVTLFGTHMRK